MKLIDISDTFATLTILLKAANALPTSSHDVRQTSTLECTTSGPAINDTKLKTIIQMWRIAKIGEVTPMNTTIHNTTRISDSMVTLSIMNQCGTNESTSRHALCLDGLHSCATCPSNTPNFTLGGDVSSKCLDYGIEVGALPTIKLIVTRSQAEMCFQGDETACEFGSTTWRT